MAKADKEGQRKAPILRFKGFTDDWEQRKLNSIFETVSKKGFPNLPVLTATQTKGMIYRNSSGIDIKFNENTLNNYKLVEPNQFVVHLRSFQGGLAASSLRGIASPAYTILKFKNNKQGVNFWKEFFRSKKFINSLVKVTYGIRDGRTIKVADLLDLKYRIPGQNLEQCKIGQLISSINKLLTLYERKLKLLSQVKKYFLDNLFAEKEYPNLRFKGFTDAWEQRKLGEVSKKLKSYSLTRSVESRTKTQIKYVHYGDIHTGIAQNITINNKLPWIKLDQSKEIEKLKRGDIIVADASEDYKGIADAALIEESLPYNIIAGLHTIAFRPNNQLMDSKFIFYSLQNINFKRYGYKIGTGLKVFGISANNFFNFNLKFPSILEQNKISTIINKLKNLLALYENKQQHLTEIKNTLLNTMFI